MPELFKHQREIADFTNDNHRALVFADPGTGKTAAVLTSIKETGQRAIVFCPKSIMGPAWVEDCKKFTPDLTIDVAAAPAKNRERAFKSGADIVVINHDGAKWLMENQQFLGGFNFLVLDESTAFKNKDAARSRAIQRLAAHFDYRVAMTGTPMSNGLLDVWHQAYVIDDGEHLGARYYAFRAATHDPIPVTLDIKNWVPKDGALEAVADMLAPIALRYKLEDCLDMPEHQHYTRKVTLSKKLRAQYDEMEQSAVLAVENNEVSAVNAASLMTKLLQIASGSIYGEDNAYKLAPERYDLIAELVDERVHPTVVGFQWRHQRDGLVEALERHGIDNFAILDGEHNRNTTQLVDDFQAGKYRCLLAHPQAAGHGLTLTAAKTTIWASPTWNAELFEQLNRRIYRAGQTERTETIMIAAQDTVEEKVIAKLLGKTETQNSALDLLQSLTTSLNAA